MAKLALRRSHMLAAAALAGLLASCANGPQATPVPPVNPPASPAPETGPISYAPSGNAEMDAWRADFSARALAAGHSREIVSSVLTGISPLELWLGGIDRIHSAAVALDAAVVRRAEDAFGQGAEHPGCPYLYAERRRPRYEPAR